MCDYQCLLGLEGVRIIHTKSTGEKIMLSLSHPVGLVGRADPCPGDPHVGTAAMSSGALKLYGFICLYHPHEVS